MTARQEQHIQEAEIPPIEKGLYRSGADGALVLTGTRCPDCDRAFYPALAICPDCGTEAVSADLGSTGVIYSQTTIRTRPPFGLPQPYSVAYLDLEAAPLRIFALLDPAEAGAFRIGDRVTLSVAPIGDDGKGNARLRPYFARSQEKE